MIPRSVGHDVVASRRVAAALLGRARAPPATRTREIPGCQVVGVLLYARVVTSGFWTRPAGKGATASRTDRMPARALARFARSCGHGS